VIFEYHQKDTDLLPTPHTCFPLVHSWLTINLSLRFMQGNTPRHTKPTIKEMRKRGIFPIFWPHFSPGLNPIEAVWNKMKDWIAKYYSGMMSYDELRVVVGAA
jgi:DDE superfamily endonuclease